MSASPIVRTAFLTALALVAFAGNSILCRMALREGAIDPRSFTALRIASGALVLAPLLLRGERPWSLRAAVALCAYAVAFSFAYVSLDTGTGALLLFGAVQGTMIGTGLARGERPGLARATGIVAAAAGVVLLVLPGVRAPDPRGAVAMVVAGLAWGAYSLIGRGVRAPFAATACNFLLATPAALLVLAVGPEASITAHGAALAVVSGALTSGLGYVVWYAALPGHSATSAAVVQLAVPVIAAAGGVALLGEEPTLRLLGAGALTLGGVAVALLARGTGKAAAGPARP